MSECHPLIKELGLMPPNELTCRTLANYFYDHRHSGLCAELVGIRAVSRGNGYLGITEALQGSKKPICVVGKGIVFDSGGANLKRSMGDMKFDMLGAATTLALHKTLKTKQSMVYMGCIADNYFGEGMLYPSYVLTYPNGTKVEITNTDAEGRLVLADGILEAKKYNPKLIITIATLTGAAVAALGPATAAFTNRPKLLKKFMSVCSKKELIWELPIWDIHRDNIKGPNGVADIINCGTIAGASTAAAFLEHFVGDTPWIHLDIAGSAYKDGVPTGCMLEPLKKFIGSMK